MSIRKNAYTIRQLRWAWRIHRIVTYPADFIIGLCYFYIQVSTTITRRYLGTVCLNDSLWSSVKFHWKFRDSWDDH